MLDDVDFNKPGMTDEELCEFKIDEEVKAIVIDYNFNFSFRMITIIGLYLRDPNVIFVSTAPDPTLSTGKRNIPDVGAMMKAIQRVVPER